MASMFVKYLVEWKKYDFEFRYFKNYTRSKKIRDLNLNF